MIKLDFKTWLESHFGGTHYPSQMYPANRAGVRDVRFGYSMNTSDTPSVVTQIGSDVVTGMGSIFRRSMGSAFPQFGSGYRNYFDHLTSAFQDGKDFAVVRNEPYDEDQDDPRQSMLKNITTNALQKIRSMQQVELAANKLGIDIKNRPDIVYEPSEKEGFVKIIFRFKIHDKLSDRLKLAPADSEEGEES